MAPKKGLGQGSAEFMVAISLVGLLFIIVAILISQKQSEAHSLKVFMDAKRVANSIADNINTIAQQGAGYRRSFFLPERLYGHTNYSIATAEAVLEISWGNENWAAKLITSNLRIGNLTKGGMNCVINKGGEVIVSSTC